MVTKSTLIKKSSKKSQSKPVESAELTQALCNSAGLGIYILQDGKFVYVSELFQELTGYSEKELMGLYCLDIVHHEDRELVRRMAVENLKGYSYSPYEYRLIVKNGGIKWILERIVSTEYNRKPAVMGSFMDITEHVQMENRLQLAFEELKEANAYRESLLSSMTDGFGVLDLSGNVIEVNASLLEMVGMKENQIMGLHITQVLSSIVEPAELEKVILIMQQLMKGNPVETIELVTATKQDSRTTISLVPSIARDDKGNPVMIFATMRDITEKKQSENALMESE